MLRKDTVTEELITILKKLMKQQSLVDFRLAGGTALALQLGHRRSVDIDLFTSSELNKPIIKDELMSTFLGLLPEKESRWGLRYTIQGIKVELYGWNIPFIKLPIEEEGVRMAALEDIAAMKLEAIKERQEKKDFYDLAALIQKFSLKEMLDFYKIKYPDLDIRFVADALSNIDAADETPEPLILTESNWQKTKNAILEAFDQFVKQQKRK